jgi:hypothetical protein
MSTRITAIKIERPTDIEKEITELQMGDVFSCRGSLFIKTFLNSDVGLTRYAINMKTGDRHSFRSFDEIILHKKITITVEED